MKNKPERTSLEIEVAKRTRRSFLIGGMVSAFGLGIWEWMRSCSTEDGLPWPFRRVLSVNETIWTKYFRSSRSPRTPTAPPLGTPARVNGKIGIESPLDNKSWRMYVDSPNGSPDLRDAGLTLEDIKKLPRVESVAEFRCIEGWSETFSYAGVRFSDFLSHYRIGAQSPEGEPFRYVGFETPDEEYYVSIDMKSMLHPLTVLAYEMNGAPLTTKNGAPLRLIIPVKYGVKNLKRIGRVFFSNTRPPDYWTEQGYDWYTGL